MATSIIWKELLISIPYFFSECTSSLLALCPLDASACIGRITKPIHPSVLQPIVVLYFPLCQINCFARFQSERIDRKKLVFLSLELIVAITPHGDPTGLAEVFVRFLVAPNVVSNVRIRDRRWCEELEVGSGKGEHHNAGLVADGAVAAGRLRGIGKGD